MASKEPPSTTACTVLGCHRRATHLTAGDVRSTVCKRHAGPNATPIDGQKGDR